MIIIESKIDVIRPTKKAKLLCLSRDGKILTEVIAVLEGLHGIIAYFGEIFKYIIPQS